MFSSQKQTSMSHVVVIRDNFNYYVGELNDVWISNETAFNPDDYYYESSPPMSTWVSRLTSKPFNIYGTSWLSTTITSVLETLTVNNNYHIPVVSISTPNVLEYFRKIPTSLMLVNGKPKQRQLAYTALNSASSPRLSELASGYNAP